MEREEQEDHKIGRYESERDSLVENRRRDLGEAVSHLSGSHVTRRHAQAANARTHVGDAERRSKCREARAVVAAIADEREARQGAPGVLSELANAETNRAAHLALDLQGRG